VQARRNIGSVVIRYPQQGYSRCQNLRAKNTSMSHTPLYPLRSSQSISTGSGAAVTCPICLARRCRTKALSGKPGYSAIATTTRQSPRTAQRADGRYVMTAVSEPLMGRLAKRFLRFPLLLKFSTRVRCSPSRCILDIRPLTLLPEGRGPKTEPGLCYRRENLSQQQSQSRQPAIRRYAAVRLGLKNVMGEKIWRLWTGEGLERVTPGAVNGREMLRVELHYGRDLN